MKVTLKISILLNLALLGGLIFSLTNQRKDETAPAPVLSEAGPPAKTAAVPASAAQSNAESGSLRWSQLASTMDYRAYIANLRAIGCPEPTIEDIVRGDTERAFSWERRHLGLEEVSPGPWSRQAEMQLVASLLGKQPTAAETTTLAQNTDNGVEKNGSGNEVAESSVPAQSAVNRMRGGGIAEGAEAPGSSSSSGTLASTYPSFRQNANWSTLSSTADQPAATAQAQQQYGNENGGSTPNPNNPASQSAGTANPDPFPSAQERMLIEQQQYNAWYQPQVAAAAASGEPLTINPAAFH
ncbi:MAG: hypothetical protein WBN22_11805 [Verrucomicrobiia bacterium]